MLLMFIGACAGSTGGGFKVSAYRHWFQVCAGVSGAFLHPRAVRKVKFEDKDVDSDTMHAVCVYFIAAIGLFVISVLLISLDGFDLVSTFTAVAGDVQQRRSRIGDGRPVEQFCRVQRFFQNRDDDGYAAWQAGGFPDADAVLSAALEGEHRGSENTPQSGGKAEKVSGDRIEARRSRMRPHREMALDSNPAGNPASCALSSFYIAIMVYIRKASVPWCDGNRRFSLWKGNK